MAAPSVATVDQNTVRVDHAASPFNGGAPITRFDLRYSTDEESWNTVQGIARPEDVSGLTPGTTYSFQTSAVNPIGAGLWSVSTTVATAPAATAPAALAAGQWALSATGVPGEVTVSVIALPSDGGSLITDLEYRVDAGAWISLGGASVGDYSFTSAAQGIQIQVDIRALNAVGSGAASDVKTVTPLGAASVPDVMAAPTLATVPPAEHRTVHVTLAADPPDGGSAVTRRDLRFSTDQASWTTLQGVIGTSDLEWLAPSMQYFVQTRAVNDVDPSPSNWSTSAAITTAVLPALVIDNALEPFRGQIRDITSDGIIDTDSSAVLASLEQQGALERFSDGRTRFVTASNGPSTSAGGRARSEFRGETERAGNVATRFRWRAQLVSFTDSGGPVDGGRAVFGQIFDSTNGEDIAQIELRRNTSDVSLRIRYSPTVGATSQSFTLKPLAIDGGGVSEIADVQVEITPTRLRLWLDGRDPDVSSPDWDSNSHTPFARTAAIDYYYKLGNYIQLDQSTSPVAVAVVDILGGTNNQATVVDATAPILSLPVANASSGSTATWGVSSDEVGGTIFSAIRLSANPLLTRAEIENGVGDAVATDVDSTPTADGTNSGSFSGLAFGTSYSVDSFQRDASGNESAVVSSAAFNTWNVPDAFVDADWSLATGAGANELDITIAALPASNGSAITDVEYDVDGTGTWTGLGSIAGTITVSMAAASTGYAMRLRAVNALGTGAAGNSEGATSGAAGPTAPVIALVGWNEITDDASPTTDAPSNGNWHWAVTLQSETLSADGSGGWTGGAVLESGTIPVGTSGSEIDFPTTSGTAEGARRMHLFQRTSAGVDSNVDVQDYTADNVAPSAPSSTMIATGSTIADASVNASEPGGTIYVALRLASAPAPTADEIKNTSGSVIATLVINGPSVGANIVSFSGLAPQTAYRADALHVDAARNESGVGTSANAATTWGAPDAFAASQWGVATGPGSNEIDLSITALPNDRGDAIAMVQYEVDASAAWLDLPGFSGTGSYVLTMPAAATSYGFRLRAVNSVGNSAAGNTESATSGASSDATAPVWTNVNFNDPGMTLAADLTEASGAATMVWATADPVTDPTFSIGSGWAGATYETGSIAIASGPLNQTIAISGATPDGARELTFYAYDAAGNLSAVQRVAFTQGSAASTPTYAGSGNGAASFGAITLPLPAHQSGDILVAVLAQRGNQGPHTTPSGWTNIVGDGNKVTSSGSFGGDCAIEIYYKLAASGSEANPSFNDTGSLNSGAAIVVRGATSVTLRGTGSGSGAAVSIGGGTTGGSGRLLVGCLANRVTGQSSDQTGAWANPDLASITKQFAFQSTTGEDAGVNTFSAGKATAGAFTASTTTLATGANWAGCHLEFAS